MNEKLDQEEPSIGLMNNPSISASDFGVNPFKCKTNAAWKDGDVTCGLGWFLFEDSNQPIHIGLKGMRQCFSATHAELLGLVWAMRCMIDHIQPSCVLFESDCKELLAIAENPKDWPIYHAELADFVSLKEKFPLFTLFYAPRASNFHADFLARGTRNHSVSFSFVNFIVPLRLLNVASPLLTV